MKKISIFVLVISLIFSISIGLTAFFVEADLLQDENFSVELAKDRLDSYTTIYVSKGKNFKILQLTDSQVKFPVNDYDKFGGSNEQTMILVERMIKAVKPDLVVFTGDLVMSQIVDNWQYLKVYAELMERLDVYWTMTFGNHDVETSYVFTNTAPDSIFGQTEKGVIIERLQEYSHCLISKGDAGDGGGTGNHIINIRDKASNDLIYSLVMFDTVWEKDVDETYHRAKTPAQVEWYVENINNISDMQYGENSDEVVKSFIYAHVAVPQIWDAYNEAKGGETANSKIHYGHILEGVIREEQRACTLFDTAYSLGSTKAMFFGHHHDNDAMVTYKGIDLVFGQHSGLSHYYRIDKDEGISSSTYDLSDIFTYGDMRGGTLLTIHCNGLSSSYTIEPKYAYNTIEWDDIKIDYEETYNRLSENENNTVTR